MTHTAERPERTIETDWQAPVPRRPLLSRMHLGHVLMLIAGLASFLLVLTLLGDRAATVAVAVADADLEPGAPLRPGDFRPGEVVVDAAGVVQSLLTVEEAGNLAATGAVASHPIRAGDPLRPTDFLTGRSGERHMSIPISADRAVAGVLGPGDTVDVIVVRDGEASYVATAVDVAAVAAPGDLGSRSTLVVTVTIDAPTSLRLAAAMADGSIDLVRSTGSPTADPAAVYRSRDE